MDSIQPNKMYKMRQFVTLIFAIVSFTIFAQTSPGEYEIKLLKVNTKYSDFGTTFFGKDKVVFASPKDNAVITRTTWEGNKQAFLDLYIGKIDENNEIVGKRRILGDINTKFHESNVCFTKDLKTVYYSANNTLNNKALKDSTGTVNIQLYKADVAPNGSWKNIVKLPFNNSEFSTGHPTLNIDDTKLYFISDRPESIGKTDIYVVDINDDGTYSEPKNLGPRINTEEREMFPFISDENILYFSSNGLPGYGELDVFASKIYDTTVAVPINLEDPVNSKKDDFAYIIDDTKLKGFFSSNRKGGKGDDDIYTFVADPGIQFECNQVVNGITRDKDTQEILPGTTVVVLDSDGKELFTKVSSEEDASFSFELPCDTEFKLTGTASGYLQEELESKTANDIDVDPLELFLDLAPELIVVNEKIMININTIYFDFDKWNIRPDAAKELDKVIAVMKEHPSMVIEGGSHTDSRAREAYNQILSEKRAKATVDYIIARGIDPSRLTSKGYGEMQLVNNCSSFVKCKREEHQLNRRTEFVIVNDNDRFASNAAGLENVKVDRTINRTYVDLNSVVSNRNETVVEASESISTFESSEGEVVSVERVDTNDVAIESQNTGSIETTTKFIKIAPIYYEFDKWSVSNKELVQLDKVVRILRDNPGLVIEVGAHTDSKNRESYNQIFSDKRAKSVVDYLVSKSINANRITAKGYGEMRLVNRCTSFVKCSEIEQQANRRIEFMIVSGNNYPNGDMIDKNDDKFINTNPIYFDYDKADIRKDAEYELKRVANILKKNPEMRVEAGSHSDSNNLESYNQKLSERRASAVKNYLISKGIRSNRIVSKGYGEMRLINNCSSFVKCTPEQHQENRRTEFKILKM